jgi:DNA-binding NarL/FixJ family response regulator
MDTIALIHRPDRRIQALGNRAGGPLVPTTVAIVSSSPLLRAGIRQLLLATAGFRVVAEGEDLAQAQRAVEAYRPTVLIASLTLAELHDVDRLKALTQSQGTYVLLVLPTDAELAVAHLLDAGIRGCVLTTVAPHELVLAVDRVSRGNAYVNCLTPPRQPAAADHALTSREYEVLELVAQGFTSKQIADRLYVSVRTVEAQRASIRGKTGAQSRADLVAQWRLWSRKAAPAPVQSRSLMRSRAAGRGE